MSSVKLLVDAEVAGSRFGFGAIVVGVGVGGWSGKEVELEGGKLFEGGGGGMSYTV